MRWQSLRASRVLVQDRFGRGVLIREKADWVFLVVEGLIALWTAGEDKAGAVAPAINANHWRLIG